MRQPARVCTAAVSAAAIVVAASAHALPFVQATNAESRFALALVNDPRGKPLVDIGIDDFVVQEGGAARDVLDVRVADYPVVIVVDNGSGARGDFSLLKPAVVRLVERLGPRPLAVVTTAAPPQVVASFEDDRETVLQRIHAIDDVPSSDGQPLRATALAARTLQSTGTLFSTIVLVTASPFEASGPAADEFIGPVVDSRAVVHVVADESGATAAPLLRGFARQTQGEFTAIFTAASYLPALERLAVRLTSEMLIEYLVPRGSKPIDPKIGVRVPGARVRGLGVAPR